MNFGGCQLEAYITLVRESSTLDSNVDEFEEELLPKPRVRANLIEMVAEFDEIGVDLFYKNEKSFTYKKPLID